MHEKSEAEARVDDNEAIRGDVAEEGEMDVAIGSHSVHAIIEQLLATWHDEPGAEMFAEGPGVYHGLPAMCSLHLTLVDLVPIAATG